MKKINFLERKYVEKIKKKKVWFLRNGQIHSLNQPHLNGLKIVFDSRNIKEKNRK